jgi:phosphoribosyl 1,2-cyclic phosphate phosphodiesterase
MRLLFLGTAAAEGFPGIFCNCQACNQARALGGKNVRLRSALLINDDLLIDFGPDLLASAQKLNRNLWKVRTGLVTHVHMDHFFTGHFEMRRSPFTGGETIPLLSLFGPEDVAMELAKLSDTAEDMRLEFHAVKAFDHWQKGAYTFRAYDAYHAVTYLDALFYSIDDGKHAVLYATDTGKFSTETWQALKGHSFDVVILEETMGDGSYDQHLGFVSFLEVVEQMRAEKLLRPGARIIAQHFSHSGNPVHQELVDFFAPHGVEVAFDGLEITL